MWVDFVLLLLGLSNHNKKAIHDMKESRKRCKGCGYTFLTVASALNVLLHFLNCGFSFTLIASVFYLWVQFFNRVRRQSGFPTFISCQRQDPNLLPKRRQSHQGDKLCDVSTGPLVARWPVFLARGSDADGEPHCCFSFPLAGTVCKLFHGIALTGYRTGSSVVVQCNAAYTHQRKRYTPSSVRHTGTPIPVGQVRSP